MSTDVSEAVSVQLKIGPGVLGAWIWALQPSEKAFTPFFAMSGTMPRVTPGTSRCEMTVLLAFPNFWSSALTASMPPMSRPASASYRHPKHLRDRPEPHINRP